MTETTMKNKVISFRAEPWLAQQLEEYSESQKCNTTMAIHGLFGDSRDKIKNLENEIEPLKKDNLAMADQLKNYRAEKNLQNYQPPVLTVPSEAPRLVDPRPEFPLKTEQWLERPMLCPMSGAIAERTVCLRCNSTVWNACKVTKNFRKTGKMTEQVLGDGCNG
jgi:hypothetical protein